MELPNAEFFLFVAFIYYRSSFIELESFDRRVQIRMQNEAVMYSPNPYTGFFKRGGL